jgi:hypothetical protein
MATIKDLFKSQKKDLYGKLGEIRIETRGFVDVARSAALLTSSPDKLGDAIGNQLGGALGGSANRPSDTIFKGTAFFRKPITLIALTQAQLRDSVDGGRKYFVKENPAPNSIVKRLLDGQSPAGAAGFVAAQALNKFGSPKALKKLAKELKTKIGPAKGFGAELGRTEMGGKPMIIDKKFSEYKQVIDTSFNNYPKPAISILTDDMVTSVKERSAIEKAGWDGGTKHINEIEAYDDISTLNKDIKSYREANQTWVLIKKEGNSSVIPFAGSVTGLSEDISPEWSSFKYLGSPFKVNRYQGVERSLKFNLKLYYTTVIEKNVMMKKINYLKSLTFPYETISEMKYGAEGSTQTSQYAFSPNLIYLTIGDMYKNIYGYVDSLSFSVEDNTVWPSADASGLQDGRDLLQSIFGIDNDNHLYPSVIDVSFSMKIIENHKTVTEGGITKYKYNFDGLSYQADGVTPTTEYDNVRGLSAPFIIDEK